MDDIVAKPLKADLLKRMLKENDRRRVSINQLSSHNQASSNQIVSESRGLDLSPPIKHGEKFDMHKNSYKSVQSKSMNKKK